MHSAVVAQQTAGGVVKAPFSIIETCGQVEYSFGKVRGPIAGLVAVVNFTDRVGVQTIAVFTLFTRAFYQTFSTTENSFFNLLYRLFSPLSTGPIKNKYKVRILTVINWSK